MKNRRQFIQNTTAAVSIISLPSLLFGQPIKNEVKKKIVCIGGHPDDPESGCGGTLVKLKKLGHDVTIIYLTTGEAGISGKSHTESASIRKGEALNACKIIGAKAIFAGQIDGATVFNKEWVEKVQEILKSERPELVCSKSHVDC